MKSKSSRFFTPNDLSKRTTFDKFVLRATSKKGNILSVAVNWILERVDEDWNIPLYFWNRRFHKLEINKHR